MPRPEERLYTKLSGTQAVTDLADARIWPVFRPDSTLPCVVYECLGDQPENYASGATGAATIQIRVYCEGSTYGQAKALAAAVRGDEDPADPSGLSGWIDGQGNVWHMDDARDATGLVLDGQNILDTYIVEQDYQLDYRTAD